MRCQYCSAKVYDGICTVCETPASKTKTKYKKNADSEDGWELGVAIVLAALATMFLA